jgi:hypothetical protein
VISKRGKKQLEMLNKFTYKADRSKIGFRSTVGYEREMA